MPASFSKTDFCCCLSNKCRASTKVITLNRKWLWATASWGCFWAGNWKWDFCVLFTSPLHLPLPPLLPPCLALRHTVVWICHWWMISKTRSCPHHQMWMLGRWWLLHKEWPQFKNVEQKQILIIWNNYWKEKKNNVLLLHVWLLPPSVVPSTGSPSPWWLLTAWGAGTAILPTLLHWALHFPPTDHSISQHEGKKCCLLECRGSFCSQRLSWPQPGMWLNADRAPGALCKRVNAHVPGL